MATHEGSNKEENVDPPTSLLSNAKVVAEAAQAALRKDPQSVDKAKAADAAAELLDAGQHYAKLEQSSYGKYIDKAEDYLHQVKSDPGGTGVAAGDSKEADNKKPTATATEPEKEEGGTGGIMKMAQGFLK